VEQLVEARRGRGGTLIAVTALRRGLQAVATAMAYVAGWNYVACALFITFDVVARSTLGFSSKTTVEITGYSLAFGIAWALAHTLVQRAHIRVDVLVNRFAARPRQLLHGLALLLLALFAVFCAWVASELAGESWLFNAHDNSALSIPLILPQGLWSFGIVFFAVLVVVLLVEVGLLLLRGRGDEVERLLGPRTLQDETKEALEAVAMAREAQR
jgi:TRAP-type C4-dicarboxylate transport system permease small subunit